MVVLFNKEILTISEYKKMHCVVNKLRSWQTNC